MHNKLVGVNNIFFNNDEYKIKTLIMENIFQQTNKTLLV